MSDPVIPPSSDARTALRALIQQKDVLEAQLEALSTQANAGQELVDAEGFPRAGQSAALDGWSSGRTDSAE